MILLRLIGALGALAFGGALGLSQPRSLTELGLLLLALAAALVGIAGVVTLNRWVLTAAAVVGLAALAFAAPGPWAALVAGLGVLLVVHTTTTLGRIKGYAERVGPDTVTQAVRAHQRNLPGPLSVLVLTLAAVAFAPWVLGQLLGDAAASSLELTGVVGLAAPGLIVLVVPLGLGAWRARGG